jgi:hypothetical protein
LRETTTAVTHLHMAQSNDGLCQDFWVFSCNRRVVKENNVGNDRNDTFCLGSIYLEPHLSLATPNGFEQTRSLGASAPGDLLIAPSGIFEYIV